MMSAIRAHYVQSGPAACPLTLGYGTSISRFGYHVMCFALEMCSFYRFAFAQNNKVEVASLVAVTVVVRAISIGAVQYGSGGQHSTRFHCQK